MSFDLIVEPGVGIGPVKLGMTREDIVAFGVDLTDDLFRTHFDDQGRCAQIHVFVSNNKCPVLLEG